MRGEANGAGRFAIFVDAGYLLAAGAELCLGPSAGGAPRRRGEYSWKRELIPRLIARANAENDTAQGLLRVYWYDAARDRQISTLEHHLVASLPDVKLRLGHLSSGGQKGVDSLLVRDLITLADQRAMATAHLVTGDEDIREGLRAVQDVGIRALLFGVLPPYMASASANQSDTLVQEADRHIWLDRDLLVPCFELPAPISSSATSAPADLGYTCAKALAESIPLPSLHWILRRAYRVPGDIDMKLRDEALRVLKLADDVTMRSVRNGFWQGLKDYEQQVAALLKALS